MAGSHFTLIELHLDDATFNPSNSGSLLGTRGSDADESEDEMDGDETDDGSSGSRLLRVMLLVALFAAASVAAKKFRGEDELAELTDFDREEAVEA